MLADEQIAYEADAILLVEREGDERTITPIIKPPRPAHLKMNKRYAATLATLYPDLVPDAEPRPRAARRDGRRKRRQAKSRPGRASAAGASGARHEDSACSRAALRAATAAPPPAARSRRG